MSPLASPQLRRAGVLLLVGVVGAGIIAALLHRFSLQRWVQARVEQELIANIQPVLARAGITIEKVTIDGSFAHLARGRIDQLDMVLKREHLRARLSGAIELDRTAQRLSVHWQPLLTLESGRERSSAVQLNLHVRATLDRTSPQVDSVELSARPERGTTFAWQGLDWDGLALDARYSPEAAHATLAGKQILWRDQASLSGLTLTLDAGPGASRPTLTLRGESGELAQGDRILSLPLKDLPLTLTLRDDHLVGTFDHGPFAPLTLTVNHPFAGTAPAIHWSARNWPLAPALTRIGSALGLSALASAKLSNETRIDTHGTLTWTASGSLAPRGAEIRIKNGDWSLGAGARLHGAELLIALESLQPLDVTLDLKKLMFDLQRTRWSIDPFRASARGGRLDASALRGHTVTAAARGARFQLAPTNGKLAIAPAQGLLGSALTAFTLSEISFQDIEHALCLDTFAPGETSKAPSGNVRIDFPRIELYREPEPSSPSGLESGIEPDGTVTVHTFDGVITAEHIGIYDLETDVPELHLSLDGSHLRLDYLGSHSGFGEMDGQIQLYAHDVVFQSWLPTQFDFRIEVKPLRRSKVVFSPDAMRNFVELVTGSEMTYLPGVAEWLAFGWPSRVFGGYDVQYAGVSLFSSGGRILLETLDPPEVVAARDAKEQKHFILRGPRFKMPLNSSSYPIVIDATAISNFARRMIRRLSQPPSTQTSSPADKPGDLTHVDPNPSSASAACSP